MCFQFDVYRNPSNRTCEYQPYFMIIQHDYYDDLSTRLIVPLSYHNHLRGYSNAATPLVNLEFQTYFLNTANITHVETKNLIIRIMYVICAVQEAVFLQELMR
ncbi:CcdB protein [Enterobacter hormaechei]|uniref:CcdB family protein n=2 Tax=Enterobacter hormaechei TaxID=158836 RepID=UPI000794F665|nr:CcdB family protein [Enterobacter hormaechei]CZW99599.1 CcdB protein [Enterobacter hormaechei]VAE44815.1 CcdB protein [Enterobacter hormaechei]VAM34513.1 CcdB protein [Enterobacter hormaechei]